MMKKYLKALIVATLLSTSALSYAAPVLGSYTVVSYDNVTKKDTGKALEICVELGGNWHMSNVTIIDASQKPILIVNDGWNGKWFSRGDSLHFIAQRTLPNIPNAAASFELTQVSKKFLTGYYTQMTDNESSSMTVSLTYKGPKCDLLSLTPIQ